MARRKKKWCDVCPSALNCINGQFCKRFKRYVEWLERPLCDELRLEDGE